MPCAGRYVTALLMRRNVSRIGLRELKWMQTTNKHYYWELRKQSKWQQNNSNRSRSQSDPHKRCKRMPTKRERKKAEKFINLLCVLALTDIKRNRLWTDKPPERHNCCRYRFGRRLPFAVAVRRCRRRCRCRLLSCSGFAYGSIWHLVAYNKSLMRTVWSQRTVT